MRRSTLLLIGELTKALYCLAPSVHSSRHSAANPPAPIACRDASVATSAASTAVARTRRTGRITEWDPFERHGVIQDAEGHRYRIANTRAFETVLPTMLRTLEGAVVEFEEDSQPAADRVIIRSRLTPITAESYRQAPPVNFLSAEMLTHLHPRKPSSTTNAAAATTASNTPENTISAVPSKPAAASTKTTTPSDRFAKSITVDIASIPAKQIARWSGPLSEEEVIKPTKNLKDMRSSRLFDRETNAFLKLKQQLGSGEEAKRLLAAQQEQAAAAAVRREVVAEQVQGVVLAWSGIHRSGLIREVDASAAGGASDNSPSSLVSSSDTDDDALCIIRNVYAFQSALPTSQSLVQRRVRFNKVTYSTQPNRFFAESVVVEGDVRYDTAVPSLEEAHAAKGKEKADALRRSRRMGAMILEEEEGVGMTAASAAAVKADSTTQSGSTETAASRSDSATARKAEAEEPVDPNKMYYGVIVRWSGGQGVVEGGDGRHFYLRSAAAFVQLVDQSSHQLRGAVVQFKRDAASPRFACEVDILSTAATNLSEVKPMLERAPFHGATAAAEHAQDTNGSEQHHRQRTPAATAPDVEPEGVEWTYGTLLSWSALEGHGIVLSDADQTARYVLRDPAENVIAYKSRQTLLKKGRKVKFTTFGSTGRLVCNVVLLETEADEEALQQAELQRPTEPELSMDGNKTEAIPSPMSTSYWLNRMDKAGYDTREVKELQNRALTLDEDDDDDGTEGGKFLDSEELLKKDHWWNDPRKNVRFPNSDMTAGHLALIGPASMMNVAMKTKDPKKLDKMLKKYQSRLTEDQKEYAWKQAKEMAPKYEECVRKGRERNEEPKFYFF